MQYFDTYSVKKTDFVKPNVYFKNQDNSINFKTHSVKYQIRF
jgi:hypothetical protein